MDLKKFVKTKLPPVLLIVLAVVLDQWTKALAVAHLKPIYTFPIIKDIFHFTYATNRGAAFSMLADHPWVFMLVSAVAIVGMTCYLFAGKGLTAFVRYPLAAVIGGGIGNMIDRVAVGYVVDFIDVRAINFAIFNVADCFVTVGAVLLFIGLLIEFRREEKETRAKKEEKHDDSTSA
jgi:signal peptidase II